MDTVVAIVGTVPEAVKLGPVCAELARQPCIHTEVVLSGQHTERVGEILALFGVRPAADFRDSTVRRSLAELTSSMLKHLADLVRRLNPRLVVVQGDTATALAGAQAAFYESVAVAHVEAGLTTGDVSHPFPEEFHRGVITQVATLLFAP